MNRLLAVVLLGLTVTACASRGAVALNEKGLACLDSKDLRCAVASFGEAARLAPTRPEYHHNLGVALMRAGVLDQATTEYREALRLNPADMESREWLAKVVAAQEAGNASRAAIALSDELAH